MIQGKQGYSAERVFAESAVYGLLAGLLTMLIERIIGVKATVFLILLGIFCYLYWDGVKVFVASFGG